MSTRTRSVAVFLVAFAALLTELSWTRLAGLFFYGEAAYFVVTLAVAGLSLGAALAAFIPVLLRSAAAAATGAGVTLLAGTLLTLYLAGIGGIAASLAAVAPTFVLLGVAFTGLFAGDARHAPRLYASDLLGAAAGAGLALPLVAWLGAPAASLVAASAAILAGGVASRSRAMQVAGAASTVVTLALALLPAGSVLSLEPPAATWRSPKSLVVQLNRDGTPLATTWGTLGRSDLIERGDSSRVLYLDGSAGSLVPTPGVTATWRSDPGRLPFEALRPGRVFVIGAGAGVEVAHALETGATDIVAAEVNAAGARLVDAHLAGDTGNQTPGATGEGPFRDPRATWVFDEARSVLASMDRSWDLIATSQAVTRTVEARGLALTENGLYTVESLRAMLQALAPGGALTFEMYDEATLTRILFTAGAALREEALAASDAEALAHTIAVLDPATQPPTPLLFVFRDAPDPARIVDVARAAEARGMALLHLPGLLENPPLDGVANGSATFADLAIAADGVDLRPTRDDRPFFWSFEPGIPRALQRALGIVLMLSVLLALPLVVTPSRGGVIPWRARLTPLLVGFAFLMLELAILSKATLLVGHPAAALAATLVGLLIGMGFGSLASRDRNDDWQAALGSLLLAALASMVWLIAWSWIAGLLAPAPAPVRIASVLLALLPLGFFLGVPFPTLLRRFGREGDGRSWVARAWALNGVGSLLAGVATVALAHVTGFQALAIAATGLYLFSGVLLVRLPRSRTAAD